MKSTNFYGIHTANILLEKYPESIINIYIQEKTSTNNSNISNMLNLAKKYSLNINHISADKLIDLAGNNHQGVVIQCKSNSILQPKGDAELKDYHQNIVSKNSDHKFFVLILDEIQDPHNLGACIRSAEAMGVDFIITPQKNSAVVNNTVCKVSAGAALLLPVFTATNLARTMRWLKEQGIWIYGSDMDAKVKLSDIGLSGSIALVMGAEGKGIRKLTKDLCDDIFTIPMQGQTQSLNVSVATGISLYEVLRQR